jgi:hypothetical protein
MLAHRVARAAPLGSRSLSAIPNPYRPDSPLAKFVKSNQNAAGLLPFFVAVFPKSFYAVFDLIRLFFSSPPHLRVCCHRR